LQEETQSKIVLSACLLLPAVFQENLSGKVPQLKHLHMRYCKRLTDEAVNIVAKSLCHLYSLDMSFCTRLTATSIFHLLDMRSESLSELRLNHCNQLSIGTQRHTNGTHRRTIETGGSDGRLIVNAIRSHPFHCLSILDLRECGGQSSTTIPYQDTDQIVVGLKAMDFEQRVPGFFSRPAR
jgi:hypothetical protein